MIRRHTPAFRGMPAFFTDSDTLAPLVNDLGELADSNDVYRFLSRSDVLSELDRLTFEMCADYRGKGRMLSPSCSKRPDVRTLAIKTRKVLGICYRCGIVSPEVWLGYMKNLLSEAATSRNAAPVLPDFQAKKRRVTARHLNQPNPKRT